MYIRPKTSISALPLVLNAKPPNWIPCSTASPISKTVNEFWIDHIHSMNNKSLFALKQHNIPVLFCY